MDLYCIHTFALVFLAGFFHFFFLLFTLELLMWQLSFSNHTGAGHDIDARANTPGLWEASVGKYSPRYVHGRA